eukprot:2225273-Pleurochrysis_carterae.AAC.2
MRHRPSQQKLETVVAIVIGCDEPDSTDVKLLTNMDSCSYNYTCTYTRSDQPHQPRFDLRNLQSLPRNFCVSFASIGLQCWRRRHQPARRVTSWPRAARHARARTTRPSDATGRPQGKLAALAGNSSFCAQLLDQCRLGVSGIPLRLPFADTGITLAPANESLC